MINQKTRPNIVVIMLDATRADRLSCYGYRRPTTPNIDKIAANATTYAKAFAPDVWTLPIVSSIFTGLMPPLHGTDYSKPFLSNAYPTVAGLLQQQGYDTFGISAGSWISEATGLNRGFARFAEPFRLIRNSNSLLPVSLINRFYTKYIFGKNDKGAEKITRIAEDWLEKRDSTGEGEPFFLFLHYLEPHYPYSPPTQFARLHFEEADEIQQAKSIKYNPLDYLAGNIKLSDRDLVLLNRLYDGEISYVDSHVGRIYGTLVKRQLIENTVFIIFADHGENIGDHGLMDHHFCLYDSLIHVPLIIHYPRLETQPMRVTELVQTVDLFPTILKLAGYPGNLENRSFTLFPEKLQTYSRNHITAYTSGEFANALRLPDGNPHLMRLERDLCAVRTQSWKYIESSDGLTELYNLQTDPAEEHNLAETHVPKRHELQQRLSKEREKMVSPHNNTAESEHTGIDDDSELMERLRALGYLK